LLIRERTEGKSANQKKGGKENERKERKRDSQVGEMDGYWSLIFWEYRRDTLCTEADEKKATLPFEEPKKVARRGWGVRARVKQGFFHG